MYTRERVLLTVAPSLDGSFGGGAGVEAEVLCLEAGAVQRGLGGAAVDLGQGASQQLDGRQDLKGGASWYTSLSSQEVSSSLNPFGLERGPALSPPPK